MDSKIPAVKGLQSLSPEDAINAINELPFAYYRASMEGEVLAASSAMLETFGYDHIEEIIGVKVSDHYADPAGRERFLEELANGDGVVENFEAEMRGPRGKFWVATSARLIVDEDGSPIAGEGLTRDISEQRRALEELSRGAALFEAFAQAADIGVAISTKSGREIFLNPRVRELLDLPVDPPESMLILDRMSPELQTISLAARKAVMNGQSIYHQEILIPVGGQKVWRRYSLFPMTPSDTDETYMCFTAQDIDEQKRQQVQLIQSSKLASIGELAAGIAHEINQPLNVIRLATMNVRNYLKKKSLLDEKVVDTFDKVNHQIERAANIVRQLLLYGREAGDEETYCDPLAAIENTGQMTEQTLKVENIALSIEPSDVSVAIPCNLIKFEQVLMNLVSNAKDAIKERRRESSTPGFEGEVVIKIKADDERVTITVSDNGVGIPSEQRDSVLEPFVTTKPVGSGTGLGLSVSHGIIASAGGAMRFIDTEEGACAEITMPTITLDSPAQGT
ncbi:MAG: ATP-binding protein [Luminiphilus sp.]|nr:ATP-binding protein [Luminiphilus sp.]